MDNPNVRVDLGGWISGSALPVSDCRFCDTQIMLSDDGLWHSTEYPDLGGYCRGGRRPAPAGEVMKIALIVIGAVVAITVMITSGLMLIHHMTQQPVSHRLPRTSRPGTTRRWGRASRSRRRAWSGSPPGRSAPGWRAGSASAAC